MSAALIVDGRTLHWEALKARAGRIASELASAGVERGELLAAHVGSARFAELLHAARALGIALLPLNQRLTEAELSTQLGDARPRWLIDEAECVAPLDERTGPGRLRLQADGIARMADAPSQRAPAPPPGSLLLYTSGTTGQAKGAVLSAAAFEWGARAACRLSGASAKDRWLACMPLFHVGGIAILERCALSGGAALVHPRFDPEAVSHALDHQAVTHVSFVANMLQRLLELRGDRRAPDSLQLVLLGGGPAPASLIEHARALGYPIAPTYGLTEAASQVATRSPRDDPSRGLPPLPGVELQVVDEAGRPCATGEAGEICVRTGSCMDGYWQRPTETAAVLRNGVLHTGDIGRLDGEGRLQVLDRRSDLILSGGENVYPAEIEAVMLTHPDVVEAGVAGRPDARYGARPHAWYVGRAREDELRQFCAGRLARYKQPVEFQKVSALPRGPAGKLLRARLGEAD